MKATSVPEWVGQRPMGYFARPMRAEDVAQVAQVERECFPTGWIATPFRRELKNRMAAYLVACEARDPGHAEAEARGLPVALDARPKAGGFGARLMSLFKSEPAPPPELVQRIVGFLGIWFMVDEAHITAIGVKERCRRAGIGELLLLAALEKAVLRGGRVATLEVRVSNRGAQALYEKYGFKPAGVRKGYYTDNREDALIMTTEAIPTPEYQRRLQELRRGHAARWGPSVRIAG